MGRREKVKKRKKNNIRHENIIISFINNVCGSFTIISGLMFTPCFFSCFLYFHTSIIIFDSFLSGFILVSLSVLHCFHSFLHPSYLAAIFLLLFSFDILLFILSCFLTFFPSTQHLSLTLFCLVILFDLFLYLFVYFFTPYPAWQTVD